MKIAKVGSVAKNMLRIIAVVATTILLIGAVARHASAEVIDNIEIKQVGGQAEIELHFITRILYKRQATLKNGDVRIYLTLLNIDPKDPRLEWEKKDSPSSDIVPPFTVTYPELDSSLTLSFGKVVKVKTRAGSDGKSIVITTKVVKQKKADSIKSTPTAVPTLPAAAAAIVIATDAVNATAAASVNLPEAKVKVEGAGFATDMPIEALKTPEQIQQEAQLLFVAASDALQNNQIDASIESLNKVLNLPPNVLTQPAQELMGEAREKNGEFVKAKAEYELYLKLYPNAADKAQVSARIANLPITDVKPVQTSTVMAEQNGDDGKLKVTGGISQNYYRGNTHTDTFATDTANPANPPVTSSFSGTDQSQLVTSVDLMAQQRTETRDTRLVLREYNRFNFLPNQPEEFRWNSVYLEQGARDRKYMFRLGRQSGSAGGVPGRFDGLAGGVSLNQMWRLNAAIGRPVEFVTGGNPADPKTFYSGSIDLTRLPDQWSGSAYGVLQYVGGGYKTGGIRERTAFGLEAHYFDQHRSYLSQVEFDTIYHKVNLATFQGNWTQESGNSYYFLVDHRRSPPLALNLQGQWTQSVKELLRTTSVISLKTLRDNAIALSPLSNMMSIGLTRPYGEKLRFSSDFRVSNTGGTGAVVTTVDTANLGVLQQATNGSGNQYAWSAQAMGNNLIFENDLGIASYTYSDNTTSKSHSLTFSQIETFRQKWRADIALQLFSQQGNDSSKQTQVRPSLTLNYRTSDALSFSVEGGLERYHSTNLGQDSKTSRQYFYMGYRWDFR